MVTNNQFLTGKLDKNLFLGENIYLSHHLPPTVEFSKNNLEFMLLKYPEIYIKPDKGRGDRFVFNIVKGPSGYIFFYKECEVFLKDIDQLYNFLEAYVKNRKFIIQQGIPNLYYKNRIFAIRVIVQRPLDKWEVTGIAAKITKDNSKVIKIDQTSDAIELDKLLEYLFISPEDICSIYKKLTSLSQIISNTLSSECKDLRILGIDFTLDVYLSLWIIDVTFTPNYKLFKGFEDKSVYNIIHKNYMKIKRGK